MNEQVKAIRERMADGYNQTPSRQSLEDIYDLLGIVDTTLRDHGQCTKDHNCVNAIAEELGVDASITQA